MDMHDTVHAKSFMRKMAFAPEFDVELYINLNNYQISFGLCFVGAVETERKVEATPYQISLLY